MIDRPQSDPVKVPLAPKPLDLWGTAMTVRRNVLEVIPAIATRLAITFGKEGLQACHLRVQQPEKIAHGSGILAEPESCRALSNNGSRA